MNGAPAAALAAGLVLTGFVAACGGEPEGPAAAGRVVVAHAGVHRIRAADLAGRLGWSDVAPGTLRLSLNGEAQPVHWRGAGADLEFWFHGVANASPYTVENVYRLDRTTAGAPPGSRPDGGTSGPPNDGTPPGNPPASDEGASPAERLVGARVPVAGGGDPETVWATVRLEENLLYEPQRTDGDTWLWRSIPGPGSAAFTATLPALAPGPARVRAALWGSTEAATVPDHQVRLTVNGQTAAQATWDGRIGHIVEAELRPGIARPGDNTVGIAVPGTDPNVLDIPVVDWIELRFPVRPVADEDRLAFEVAGTRVRLTGFSAAPAVWDVTDPLRPLLVAAPPAAGGDGAAGDQGAAGDHGAVDDHAPAAGGGSDDGGGLTLGVVPGHSYVAAGLEGVLDPVAIERVVFEPDLGSDGGGDAGGSGGAEWLAIGAAELLEPLAPLVDLRRAEGLAVAAVPVAAVFDQHGHGQREPGALSAFLRHAVATWRPAPRYVLLVGDATYDPRGYVSPVDANAIPTFLVPTVFGGQTGSDAAIADLNDDGRPDVAIGRLPARTVDQVRQYVGKALADAAAAGGQPAAEAREAAPEAGGAGTPSWRSRVLAVADGQEPSFRQSAERFVAGMARPFTGTVLAAAMGQPPEMGLDEMRPPNEGQTAAAGTSPTQGSTTEVPPAAIASEIRARIDAGVGIVAYFGHGSLGQWGRDRLFTGEAVAGLRNGSRLPIVLNFTCLTGLFTHPTADSLAEDLLWHPGGGAIAVLAPTSLTLASDQDVLANTLAGGLSSGGHARLGDAVLAAWHAVPADSPGGRDVVATFALLGDPGLALPTTESAAESR